MVRPDTIPGSGTTGATNSSRSGSRLIGKGCPPASRSQVRDGSSVTGDAVPIGTVGEVGTCTSIRCPGRLLSVPSSEVKSTTTKPEVDVSAENTAFPYSGLIVTSGTPVVSDAS